MSEMQCGQACESNPKCKGFAWCAPRPRACARVPRRRTLLRRRGRFKKPEWSPVPECYLKPICPSTKLRGMRGAHSWELQRRCGTDQQFQAQQRARAGAEGGRKRAG